MSPVSFEFDAVGQVIAATVADDWAEKVALEEFGFHAMRAYLEQRAAVRFPQTPEVGKRELAASARSELMAEALEIIREAKVLLDTPPTATVEPVTVGDPHGHIVITLVGGEVSWIELNQSWLRQADSSDVEADLVRAFRAAEEHADPAQRTFAGLTQRHQALTRKHAELRRN